MSAIAVIKLRQRPRERGRAAGRPGCMAGLLQRAATHRSDLRWTQRLTSIQTRQCAASPSHVDKGVWISVVHEPDV